MLLSKPFRQDPRVHREATSLIAAGHSVTLIQWARRDPDEPPQETIDGVQVLRVPNGLVARVAPHDALRNPLWWRRATKLGRRLHAEVPFDAVHCHDLDTLPIGVRLKRDLGLRLVFDAHEIFAEMMVGHVPWPGPALARRLERRLLPHVDLVVTVSDHLAAHYKHAARAPVGVVWNAFGPTPDEEAPAPPPDGPFIVTYIGTLSHDRLLPAMIDAFRDHPGTRLVIGGKREGVYAHVERAAQGVDNVHFLGPVPFDQVLPTTRAGHAVVCLLDPRNPQYKEALATKLFDAMACGRPIIVTEGTAMGDFVRVHDVGVSCAYTAEALRDTVTRLRAAPETCRRLGAHGLNLAKVRFNWERQAQALCDAYANLEPTP